MIYNSNMVILNKEYPDLASLVTERLEEGNAELDVRISHNDDGNPNLIILQNQQQKFLHSRYAPQREAEKIISSINITYEDTIVVVGLGLGYILEPLKNRYPDKNIVIIEPFLDIFLKALQVKDLTPYFLDHKIVFIVGQSEEVIKNLFLTYFAEEKISFFNILYLPVYKQYFRKQIQDIQNLAKQIMVSFRFNANTSIVFAHRWLNNTLTNLKYIHKHPSVLCLKERFKDIPIIIVSAGPSLQQHIPKLNALRNRALIIGVGSTVNILEKNGITPHIIMGIDGSEKEAELFENLSNTSPLFVYGHTVHYRALEGYTGKKMWLVLNQDIALTELFKEVGLDYPLFYTGPSIANIALDFACWLEPSKIILIGQDLAYTGKKLYADGAIHEKDFTFKEDHISTTYLVEQDIHGEPIYTTKPLLLMRDWFERYIASFGRNNLIVNCTEGGIPIKGIPNMQFDDAIETFLNKEHDIETKITAAINEPFEHKYEEIYTTIKKYYDDLKDLLTRSEDRLNKVVNILNNIDDNIDKLIDEVININEKIETNKFFRTWIYPNIKEYEWAVNQAVHLQLNEIDSNLEKKKLLYRGMLKTYTFTHEILLVAKAAIENNFPVDNEGENKNV